MTTQELVALSGAQANLQTQLDGKVNKNGDTMTGELVLQKGSIVSKQKGISGQAGYVNIIRIKIKDTWADYPIIFELAGRRWEYPRVICLMFNAENNTDPKLLSFLIDNPARYEVAIAKTEKSTWDIYMKKNEPYGVCEICRMCNTYNHNALEITYPNINVSELPTGYRLPDVITWDKANTANKLQTARKIKLTGAVTGEASFDGSGDITIQSESRKWEKVMPTTVDKELMPIRPACYTDGHICVVLGTFRITEDISNSVTVLCTGFPIPCDNNWTYSFALKDGSAEVRRLGINSSGELCTVYQSITAGDWTFMTLTYFVKEQVNTTE